MLYFVITLFVHVSIIQPIYSCTLYTNIVKQYEEKNIVIQHMLYAGKKCAYFQMTLSCAIDRPKNIPSFVNMPG